MKCILLTSRLGLIRHSCLFNRTNLVRQTQAAYATKLKRHEFVNITHYDTLGIGRDATTKEIKEAFITLSKKHHPDVNKEDSTATARISAINDAYSCLTDEKLRKIYDTVTFGSTFKEHDYYVPERHPGENDETYKSRFQNEHAVAWYLHTLRDRTPNTQYARKIFYRDVKILAAIMIGLHILFLLSSFDDDPNLRKRAYRNAYDDYIMGRTSESADSQYINEYFKEQYKEK
ncbi:dnaJ homolog subfamily B member 9-like [Ylistrum balloti]|uniref:dnaJ homolog subfamily B member 9-like n=1 Tax=Ylistrum balloti TaxID=509963 RepID=UPI0029057FF4|nr:dnaJ homolog subfamily B member 9-like [Ylistrum balloti]